MIAAEIACALGSTRRPGHWWRCRCQVHSSRGATLALRDGDRRLIAVCHGARARRPLWPAMIARIGRFIRGP
jgi:hypothetical protein